MKHKLSCWQWLIALPLFLLFITLTLFFYRQTHQDAAFLSFAENFLLQELCSNPINFHYSIEDASAYQVDEAALTMPIYQTGQAASELETLQQTLATLDSFQPSRLSCHNQLFYQLLYHYLISVRNVSSFSYFAEPLSPSSGVPSQLPILLAEYRLSSIADIENYFAVLEQIPDYLEGLMVYEQEKAKAGLFMSDATADKIIQQCMSLMNPEELDAGTHFLIVTFHQRLNTLVENGTLTRQQALSYESENDRLLTTVAAPAYDSLADGLTLLKGSGNPLCGLAAFPHGQDYYTALLARQTGSNRSVAEIKELLYTDLITNYNAFLALIRDNTALQESFLASPSYLPAMTQAQMLATLEAQIPTSRETDISSYCYPAIPLADGTFIHCTIKEVDDSLAPYAAPAFYMIPPLDNVSNNTIYINPADTVDELSLFTTLAHEGYPGHLYQTVYTQNYWSSEGISPLRSTLYYGGFVEGWALYTELESYRYAARLAEKEHPEAASYYTACRLNRQIQLCLYSLLDIAIHYEGASLEDVSKILASLGTTDETAVKSVYEYIVEEPANYPKYYLGYLEILELKRQAAHQWTSATTTDNACYDTSFLYRFHQFLLQNGPADFDTLSMLLQAVSDSK